MKSAQTARQEAAKKRAQKGGRLTKRVTQRPHLVVGEKIKEDIVVYPESNKINVRLLGQVYMNEPVDYWQGDHQ